MLVDGSVGDLHALRHIISRVVAGELVCIARCGAGRCAGVAAGVGRRGSPSTDGHSAGLLKDSRDQIGGSDAGRHCRTANELRGGDPLALRPTLASRLLRVLDRSRSAIIGSASTGTLAVSSGHLANLLGERPWRLRPIHRPRISDLGSPDFRPFCARRSDRPKHLSEK